MKIGLNGKNLLIEKLAGPEVFAYNLYKNLALIDNVNEYTIYLDREPPKNFIESITNQNKNFKYRVVPKTLLWTQFGLTLELLKNPVDAFFSPLHSIPGLMSLITFGKFNSTVFIHGLEYKINKEFERKLINKFLHPFVLWWTCVMSKSIVVPSNVTKSDILGTGFPFLSKKKISVIPEGVDKAFYKRTTEEVQQAKKTYNVENVKYLLFVSTIQPRKNLPRLIEAFSTLVKNHPSLENLKLLVAGKKGWEFQESLEAPSRFGVEDSVIFLGHVKDNDLPALISGAEALVNVSLMEGFGLPLLETMACETPAIVSNIPAFKDIGLETQIYVDPTNVIEIYKALEKATTTPKDSVKILKAKEISQQFTWDKTANKILQIIQSTVKNI